MDAATLKTHQLGLSSSNLDKEMALGMAAVLEGLESCCVSISSMLKVGMGVITVQL